VEQKMTHHWQLGVSLTSLARQLAFALCNRGGVSAGLVAIMSACSAGIVDPVDSRSGSGIAKIEFPCYEYPDHEDCQNSWPDILGGVEAPCPDTAPCSYFTLRNTQYAYIEQEIDRLRHHFDPDCRRGGDRALTYYSEDRIQGYNQHLIIWDKDALRYKDIMGDHHTNFAGTGPRLHIWMGSGIEAQLFTMRHEIGHAIGIVGEDDAEAFAEWCG
jgi:hypothetical protein